VRGFASGRIVVETGGGGLSGALGHGAPHVCGQEGRNMKKVITLATAVVALAVPATALADSGYSQASYSGAQHGAFADQNGDFGWLGALGGTPGYHDAFGQDPGATGYNNSHVDVP
jgi:hypothetical protein